MRSAGGDYGKARQRSLFWKALYLVLKKLDFYPDVKGFR